MIDTRNEILINDYASEFALNILQGHEQSRSEKMRYIEELYLMKNDREIFLQKECVELIEHYTNIFMKYIKCKFTIGNKSMYFKVPFKYMSGNIIVLN